MKKIQGPNIIVWDSVSTGIGLSSKYSMFGAYPHTPSQTLCSKRREIVQFRNTKNRTISKRNNEASATLGACQIIEIFVTIHSFKVSIRVSIKLEDIGIWIQHYTMVLIMIQVSRQLILCQIMKSIGTKHVSCIEIDIKVYICTVVNWKV